MCLDGYLLVLSEIHHVPHSDRQTHTQTITIPTTTTTQQHRQQQAPGARRSHHRVFRTGPGGTWRPAHRGGHRQPGLPPPAGPIPASL